LAGLKVHVISYGVSTSDIVIPQFQTSDPQVQHSISFLGS